MSGDPRLTAGNGRVAHLSLRGLVAAETYVAGEVLRVVVPLTDLLAAPGGARQRQVLRGAAFLVLERRHGHAFGQVMRDGYVGWLAEAALAPASDPTHWVSAPATHLYPSPDMKQQELAHLSFGAALAVVGQAEGFARTAEGAFVPRQHLRPVGDWLEDPVAAAERLLGTPYLWGGNSRAGVDCSGLVQLACHACGIDCPGDSDMQQDALGQPLPPATLPQRGDLMFWRGHVALVAAPDLLLHANAHHMAVAHEPLAEARARIAAQGGGPVTALRRLPQTV